MLLDVGYCDSRDQLLSTSLVASDSGTKHGPHLPFGFGIAHRGPHV